MLMIAVFQHVQRVFVWGKGNIMSTKCKEMATCVSPLKSSTHSLKHTSLSNTIMIGTYMYMYVCTYTQESDRHTRTCSLSHTITFRSSMYMYIVPVWCTALLNPDWGAWVGGYPADYDRQILNLKVWLRCCLCCLPTYSCIVMWGRVCIEDPQKVFKFSVMWC